MTLFILSFFLIYGGVHLYAFLKAKAALGFGPKAGMGLGAFMLAMVLVPFSVRMAERAGMELAARMISYSGYLWMGMLFLFFSSSVAVDFYRLSAYAAGRIKSGILPMPSASFSFFFPLAISLVLAFYGYFEAGNIRTESLTITTSKLPEGMSRLRVVQISDVHVGLIVRGERLKRILREVKRAEPDILVSTGDLVDGQIDSISKCIGAFREIKPKFGKFAVTGNHEFYAGLDQALDFTEKAGFKLLRGEAFSGPINIAGIDDQQGAAYGIHRGAPEAELLSGLDKERFTLLLKHRPVADKASIGLFDLQLSGHTHKGQIFPFVLLTRLYYPVHFGLVEIAEGRRLYVSRGSGTWGPPIRFLAPPEVTVIDIVKDGPGQTRENIL